LKNFDDFVDFVNNSDKIQNELSNVNLKLEKRNYSLSNTEDISELIVSVQNNTLQKTMKLLRYYHEWLNQNE
jgi:hypothetical protein